VDIIDDRLVLAGRKRSALSEQRVQRIGSTFPDVREVQTDVFIPPRDRGNREDGADFLVIPLASSESNGVGIAIPPNPDMAQPGACALSLS
jgi:hypothetical protein